MAGKLPVTGLLTGMSFVLILAFSIPLAFSPPATPEGGWTGP